MSTTKKANELAPVTPNAGSNAVAAKRDIAIIEAEIQFYKNRVVESSWEIGQRLNEAKEQLEHGEWLRWLEEKAEFSDGTAQRFMRLAKEYPKASPVMELGSSKALALLTLPAADREEFISETHNVAGEEKSVADMSKRELEKAVKERSEAIKAKEEAEALAKANAEKAEELEKKLAEATAKSSQAQTASKASKENLEGAKKELTDLQNSEPALPEQQDQQMMDAMRKEIAAEAKKDAETKLKKKIDQATADKAEADKKLADAEADRERIAKEREQEQKAAADRIEKLQKKLAAASSEHVTIFKTHFDNAQSCINAMNGCLQRLKDEPETQGKLTTALKALCEQTLKTLPEVKK